MESDILGTKTHEFHSLFTSVAVSGAKLAKNLHGAITDTDFFAREGVQNLLSGSETFPADRDGSEKLSASCPQSGFSPVGFADNPSSSNSVVASFSIWAGSILAWWADESRESRWESGSVGSRHNVSLSLHIL